ncbi:hypothetical protein KCV07_g5697, partial [Aureobasidium melanogenum]
MVDTSQERIYDEIEIEDMTYDPVTQLYTYPCPCGDRFEINIEDLRDGEEIAVCPSSLVTLPVAVICMCPFFERALEFIAADQPGSRTQESR